MPKMKIAVAPKPGAEFELQERDITQPPSSHGCFNLKRFVSLLLRP